MKPEVDQILNFSAGQLMTAVAPLLPNNYAQVSTSLVGFMLLFSAQEYERGADNRATDNAEMRALFRELAPLVHDAKLKTELEQAAASSEPSLRISSLNENNARLRKLVIALQEYLEAQSGDTARAGVKHIWQTLQASAARHFLKPPGA